MLGSLKELELNVKIVIRRNLKKYQKRKIIEIRKN